MDFIDNQFKKSIDLLKKKNIISSHKEVADNLGMTKQTLSGVLSGKSKIRTHLLAQFCNFYKINLYWLFYGEGSMFSDLSEIDETPEIPIKELNIEQRVEKLETLLNVR